MKACWVKQYEASSTQCIHQQVWSHCKGGDKCRAGRRIQEEHLLSGNIIKLWGRLQHWLRTAHKTGDDDEASVPNEALPPQRVLRLIRATVGNRAPLVGAKLPQDKIRMIKTNLKVD